MADDQVTVDTPVTPPMPGMEAQAALGISPIPTGGKLAPATAAFLQKQKAEREKIGSEEQAALKPEQEQLQRQFAEKSAMEKAGPQGLIQPEEFKHVKKDVSDMFSIGMAVAALGGLLTRQPMTAALNNMTGMMKGIQAGDKAAFDQEHTAWEANVKRAQEINKQKLDQYERDLKSGDTSMQATMQRMKDTALKYGDMKVAAAADANDFKTMMEAYKTDQQAAEKMLEHTDRVAERMQRIKIMGGGAGVGYKPEVILNEKGEQFIRRFTKDGVPHYSDMEGNPVDPSSVGKIPGKLTMSEEKGMTNYKQMEFHDKKLDEFDKKGITIPISAQAFGKLYNPETGGMIPTAMQEVRSKLSTPEEQTAFIAAMNYTISAAHAASGARPSSYQVELIWNGHIPLRTDSKEAIAYKRETRKNMLEGVYYATGAGKSGMAKPETVKDTTSKEIPTAEDRAWAKAHPEDVEKFKAHFGVEP